MMSEIDHDFFNAMIEAGWSITIGSARDSDNVWVNWINTDIHLSNREAYLHWTIFGVVIDPLSKVGQGDE